ncbi:MAG: bacteriohemerythrin [Terracidiphilus sp.]|nr:bacteriohemerythrin [Terracidiphilus sp.]
MALLNWSSKYSVGVQSMDSQHTILFGILNDLHDAMMKGKARTVAGELLRKLANYADEHFAAEEALMASAGYSNLAQHRILHRDLTKEVEEFVARYERGESTLNLHLLNFLRDWLTNHIEKEDHKYGAWMNEHGIR